MSSERVYVIQRHDASNLHYDLRLEFEGVLWSWALPKRPTEDPETKRLAIRVDNHSLDYADFEGTIPEGQYGAGKVSIWDKGTFRPVNVKDNKIVFDIHGEKLKGEHVLVKMKSDGKRENWLFFKKKD